MQVLMIGHWIIGHWITGLPTEALVKVG